MKGNCEIKGLIPAVITVFDDAFNVDYEATVENIRYYLECGCAGVLVSGGTGESTSLTREEKKRLIVEARKVVPEDKILMAGTGAPGTADTLALSQDAKEAGADVLLVISPFVYVPHKEGVIRHFEAVSEIGLPIIIYNTPPLTVDIDADLFTRLIQIENVVGIKESGGNLQLFADMFAKGNHDFIWCSGLDSLFFPALVMGADAMILALGNIAPKELVAVYDAIQAGDLETARAIWLKLVPIGKTMLEPFNFAGFVKEAVRLLGRPSSPPRPPICPATEDDCRKVREALTFAGLLE